LLDRTRTRVARIVRPDHTCLVLTRGHEPFCAPLLSKGVLGPLVIQPCGRSTAPAILYGLLRIADSAPSDAVAVFPSDHYVSDDARFMAIAAKITRGRTARSWAFSFGEPQSGACWLVDDRGRR
jgi:mannose-1-phosphate guanylyltransferase